ncbi:MAG TPA: DUF397 domain-containing protein [Pseudonocardiaceae bacterium]|nr:DUF397 domain-containing protein [Pseudonocardiaceae bacterium]
MPEQTEWHKSSYSNGGSGECVEVALAADSVAVRDSKHATGPVITITPAAWQAFLATTRA